MAQDDKQLFSIIKDLSGGMNNRIYATDIAESQAATLKNVDISVPSQSRKRPGTVLCEDLGNDPGVGCFAFMPDGGTNELVVAHGTKIETSVNPNTTVFTERDTGFTSGYQTTMFRAGESGEGDVLMIGNGIDNWHRMLEDHTFQDLGNTAGTGSDSPPKSQVGIYYRNRMWVLKSNLLYWSDAYPTDYSTVFDTVTNAYRIPVGTERALIGLRDTGIAVLGQDQIWGINPSITPAATDKPEKLLDMGCIAGKSAVQVGDDVFFMAKDGVRGIFRTQQDKLQVGSSYPLSYQIKEEWESLSWAYASKATAVYYDNKYFLAVPVDGSTTNNEVWNYYPATQGWTIISGWSVGDWAKLVISGQEKLYYIDSDDGSVRQAWTGYADSTAAIDYDEISRKMDMGQPLVKKVGGELKIKAKTVGDYNLTIQASVDNADWVTLGTLSLATAGAPTLPVSLPFTLVDNTIVVGSFHLDSLGAWYYVQIRIRHNATNGNDDIILYERSLVTYAEEYQSE